MGKFRGWHILAGIAAVVLTGTLGTVMGLDNTAAVMASCVAFVAVALWTDSRLSRRRGERAREIQGERARETHRETPQKDARDTAPEAAQNPGLRDDQ